MLKQYDLYIAQLPAMENSKMQWGIRPVLIASNNQANEHSPVIHVIPLTSKNKNSLPTHVSLTGFGLLQPSTALVEQTQLLDKKNLIKRIGLINDNRTVSKINRAIDIQFGRVVA